MSINVGLTSFGLGPYSHYTLDELRKLLNVEPHNIEALSAWWRRTRYVSEQTAREAARAST